MRSVIRQIISRYELSGIKVIDYDLPAVMEHKSVAVTYQKSLHMTGDLNIIRGDVPKIEY